MGGDNDILLMWKSLYFCRWNDMVFGVCFKIYGDSEWNRKDKSLAMSW